MSRADISPYLVHFTSGTTYEDAFTRLRKILADRSLIAGSRFIKGNYRCVCFSEAPLTSLTDGLVNQDYYSRYSPFAIMISKHWLFAQGGRPVIYQSAEEYYPLPDSHRWRHVLYEPSDSTKSIDFTWEREWRIKCEYSYLIRDPQTLLCWISPGRIDWFLSMTGKSIIELHSIN